MAKRKKTKTGKSWFSFLKRDRKKKPSASLPVRKRKKKDAPRLTPVLRVTLSIVGLALLAAGLTAGFMVMERYVKTLPQVESHAGPLKLLDPPAWLGAAWTEQIVQAVGGRRFVLDEDAARTVAERLTTIAWLDDIHVQATPTALEISAQYRRPVVSARVGGRTWYVDEKMIAFEALPVTAIAVPAVVGFSARSAPPAGTIWLAEDIKAAMDLVNVLTQMDNLQMMTAEEPITKPLLDEIESVDVANFAGRKSTSQPHLTLNVKDGSTKVNWGAALGQAGRNMEADEKEKITMLYQFYVENKHTLQSTVRFIELRQPQTLNYRP
ncbi:MAG: hypothetical protein GXY41_06810 [Phycisphaerae bacterium]|nr:hypothetical protein [Phycisphaerae bacterium]